MTPRKPDRALRRALAELRRMGSEDREAIIAQLPPVDRARIAGLLRGDAARPVPASPPAPFTEAGYSHWLLKRLGEGPPEAMTAEAATLLRDCAREQQGASGSFAPARRTAGLARLLRRRAA